MNGITKLCEIYGIGDHRPQGSIGHISKLAAGAPAIEPRKSPSILRELKQAKEHSDNKQYKDKAGVMRGLLTAHTDDFFVDSELNKNIVGVTHIPTGFRMHLLRQDIPPVLLEREDMSTSKLAFMKKVAVVRKVDGKWVLYTKDKSRVLGTHETPKEAYAQEYAIEKRQEREAAKSASATTPVAVNPDTGEITYAGFTVNKKQPDWLKNRPDVAGFYGDATGDANSDPTQAGTITVNDLADVWKKNPQGKDALKKLEAVRGVYSLKPDILHAAPDLTDEQDRNLNFYTEGFKLAPDKAKLMRKGTFYSRAAVGDLLNPNGNKEPELSTGQLTHLKDINTVLNDKSWYSKHKAEQLKPIKSASAQDLQEYLYSYVPRAGIAQVKEHGLLSGNEIAKPENRHLLELARPNGDADRWLKEKDERLAKDPWKTSYNGPSVLFGDLDPDKIHDKHPIKKFDAARIKIKLTELLKDYPDTRMEGSELIPYTSEEELDALDEKGLDEFRHNRRHTLSPEEIKALIARGQNPKDMWKDFKDTEGKFYASDVPHAHLITSIGKIPSKYIEFDEEQPVTKQANVPADSAELTPEQSVLAKIRKHLDKAGLAYHIVVENPGKGGASMHKAIGRDEGHSRAVVHAREAQVAWEKEHGYNPDEDWGNGKSNKQVNTYTKLAFALLKAANIKTAETKAFPDWFMDTVDRNPHPDAKIVSLKPMPPGQFVFHGSNRELSSLDIAHATTRNYGPGKEKAYEYTHPVVFASKEPSSLFTTEEVGEHKKLVDSGQRRTYHMITAGDRKLYLGTRPAGHISVLNSDGFYEAYRRLFKGGQWVDIHEAIKPADAKVVKSIPGSVFDWEPVPHYEHVPAIGGRTVTLEEYLSHAKNPKVIAGIKEHLSKPFVPKIPEALKKYWPGAANISSKILKNIRL